MLRKPKTRHGATKLLFSVLRIAVGVILVKALLIASFFWLMHLEMNAENVDGPAPEGSYGVRRAWAEDNLNVFFTSADNWIKRSQKIENNIGKVYGVAPINSPNRHGCSFGESWTKLNLQVIGAEGEGFLTLTEYNWDGRSGKPSWHEEHWLYRQYKNPNRDNVEIAK